MSVYNNPSDKGPSPEDIMYGEESFPGWAWLLMVMNTVLILGLILAL